jgi:hypothetical protein
MWKLFDGRGSIVDVLRRGRSMEEILPFLNQKFHDITTDAAYVLVTPV